jgi:hypothetical protein
MAKTLAIEFRATIADEENIEAQAIAYLLADPSASLTDIQSDLDTWLAALDACTDGQILSSTVRVLPALPGGLKSAAVAGSRVEQTGVLMFSAAGTTHNNGQAIPALSNGATVISDGKIVLTSGDPVPVYAGLLTGGRSSATVYTNAWSELLSALTSTMISFRKYTIQLDRASFEMV